MQYCKLLHAASYHAATTAEEDKISWNPQVPLVEHDLQIRPEPQSEYQEKGDFTVASDFDPQQYFRDLGMDQLALTSECRTLDSPGGSGLARWGRNHREGGTRHS